MKKIVTILMLACTWVIPLIADPSENQERMLINFQQEEPLSLLQEKIDPLVEAWGNIVTSNVAEFQESATASSEAAAEMQMIDFVDIREAKAEELLDILQGKIENLALHFPQGATLPLKPRLSGEFFEFVEEDPALYVHIKKDFYVRGVSGDLLFSCDLIEWKQLDSFATGQIVASLIKTEENPVYGSLTAEVSERK